jgi:hypothetical protein
MALTAPGEVAEMGFRQARHAHQPVTGKRQVIYGLLNLTVLCRSREQIVPARAGGPAMTKRCPCPHRVRAKPTPLSSMRCLARRRNAEASESEPALSLLEAPKL